MPQNFARSLTKNQSSNGNCNGKPSVKIPLAEIDVVINQLEFVTNNFWWLLVRQKSFKQNFWPSGIPSKSIATDFLTEKRFVGIISDELCDQPYSVKTLWRKFLTDFLIDFCSLTKFAMETSIKKMHRAGFRGDMLILWRIPLEMWRLSPEIPLQLWKNNFFLTLHKMLQFWSYNNGENERNVISEANNLVKKYTY